MTDWGRRRVRRVSAPVVVAAVMGSVAVPFAVWAGSGGPERPGAGLAPSRSTSVSASKASATPTATLAAPSPKPSRSLLSAAPKPPSARPTPTPSRTPTRTPVRPAPPSFGVPVVLADATQLITVRSSGSRATVTAWAKRGSTWVVVGGPWAGRVGSNGTVPASLRKQWTSTTPAGTFTLTEAFGLQADPGALLPYHRVTADDWWVQDNASPYYNQMRQASLGGFDTTLPPSAKNSSEHLITYTTQYRYAVVIDFNRWPAVRYRGAGIFLHVNGPGATGGCVSVPESAMVWLLRWLRPDAHPRIAIR